MKDANIFDSIAVVGLSFRLPGDANDIDSLWKLLESGEPAWTPVPADRDNGEAFHNPSTDDSNGTSNHPSGHFISGDIRDFDHSFFRYSKSEAASLDPRLRILMELSYEAFENAGITRESIAGTATGVYAASFPMDSDRHLYKELEAPTHYTTCVKNVSLSDRISRVLDLRGPSLTLDTACSGVALHLACQSLQDGESNSALVTASNLILEPDYSVSICIQQECNRIRVCYPSGDRGEGVVALVLKRLDDAIRDRDPVRAVIRGTAVGHDGFTPNSKAQAGLVRAAFARAGLRPEEVVYVEVHGTGTKPSNSEELNSIAEVFATANRTASLYVGSFEGAIGNTESASGLASLVKATIMLDRELIPPVASFANPKAGLRSDKMKTPTKMIPWPHTAGILPRISINSFGFGGTNAHTILERGPRAPEKSCVHDTVFPRLFTISANSPASLKSMIQAQYDWLDQHAETSLADLSYTLLHRRSAMPYRFSSVAENHASLLAALHDGLSVPTNKPPSAELDVVFICTGQGATWAGMGRELLLETTTPSSIFRDSISKSGEILRNLGARWDLKTELLKNDLESRLNEAELSQPATTAIQIALMELLRAQEVRPRAVVGHSSGEIAAAYAAGHLSHATALKVAFHCGFMAKAVQTKGLARGAMLSVGLGEGDVAKYLKDLQKGKASVACINSPRSVTIAGDVDAIDELDRRIAMANDGTFHRKLLVDTAYHSHHMEMVADDYRARLGTLDVVYDAAADSKEIAFISSVTGQPKVFGFGAEYWIANIVCPVRFSDAIQALLSHRSGQETFFVEIGPHPALSGPVRQCLQLPDIPKFPFSYQAPLQRKIGAVSSVLALAGKLFERGICINWNMISALTPGADTAVTRYDLPAYRWQHSGMELSSLPSHYGKLKSTHDANEICYELDWRTDIEYMRTEDLPVNPDLADIIAKITLKRYGLSSIGLGASVELSEELLTAVESQNKLTLHDFVDATPGHFEDAVKQLEGLPVQFRALRPGTDPVTRGFEAGGYDLVLVSSAKWLDQAAVVVKPGGSVVLVLSGCDTKDDSWRTILQGTSDPLAEQLAIRDKAQDRLIVVAKPMSTQIPTKIHILTHSIHNAPTWVSAIENGLRASEAKVSLETLSPSSVNSLVSNGAMGNSSSDTVILVVDDRPSQPILNDANFFNAATTLLRQPARIVWVSPDDPISFHQIVGVARTAHAENDDLRLTTVHAASDLLADKVGQKRLVEIVAGALSKVGNPNVPNLEREYRILGDGAVLVPRLHRSGKLNRAITNSGDSGPETESHQFMKRPLVLSSGDSALFVDDEKVYASNLADDAIEVDSQTGLAVSLGEYAWANANATYVVAGDLGDIGQSFLSLMAHRGSKHVAILSRRTVNPEILHALQSKLEAIQPGIRLYALQSELSSKCSLQAAAATLASQGAPPVRGIIQGATSMNDHPLKSTTYEEFSSVVNTKVNGTLALLSVFASPNLSFFLSLSSVSSIIGTSAQASYNAGNAMLDVLAHQKQSGNTRFLTVNIGWIEDATMPVEDKARQSSLSRVGLKPIRAEELIRFFDQALTATTDPNAGFSQAVIGFDVESLSKATTSQNDTIHSALFSQVRHARRATGSTKEKDGANASFGEKTFEQVIADGNSEAVTDFISDALKKQLAKLISVDVDSIDIDHSSILALGLDSLVAVELRNWLMRQFDAPLQSTEISATQTVRALAEKVATRSKKVASG